MAARLKNANNNVTKLRRPPAATPEGRENQLISLAVDLAERQLAEGTASSQVISHYLKLGSSREKLEQERLSKENELLEVKKAAMESAQRVEALYEEAMNAFRSYAGQGDEELDD
jgi:hypothetical protein